MRKILIVFVLLLLVFSFNLSAIAASGAVSGAGTGDTNIDINAKYSNLVQKSSNVSVDISWGAMEFTYTVSGTQDWDPDEHKYTDNTTAVWTASGNDIVVVNHSNKAIEATLSFESAVNGINGAFTESSGTANDGILSLPAAENTEVSSAPSATALFNITSGSITADGKIGTITVSIAGKEAASTPTVVAQIGEPQKEGGCFDLFSTAEAGIYEAVIRRGNSNYSGEERNFVYYPAQLIDADIPKVIELKNEENSGIELREEGQGQGIIEPITRNANSSKTIELLTDNEYRLILDFTNMTWYVEEIE